MLLLFCSVLFYVFTAKKLLQEMTESRLWHVAGDA